VVTAASYRAERKSRAMLVTYCLYCYLSWSALCREVRPVRIWTLGVRYWTVL